MPTLQLNRWTPKGSDTPVRIYVNGLAGTDQDEKVWIERVRGGMMLKRRRSDGKVHVDNPLLEQVLLVLVESGVAEETGISFEAIEALARTNTGRPAAARGPRAPRANQADLHLAATTPGPGWRHPQAEALDLATIPLKGPVEILVDHREPALLVTMLRENPLAQVSVGTLSLGDIAINRSAEADPESTDPEDFAILVERKDCTASPTDFESSIINEDKRFFYQTEGLKLANALGVLMLEGDVYSNSTRMDLIQQVDGALTFATAIQRMSVLPTLSLRHSAYVILKLAQHQRWGLGYELGLRAEKPKTILDRSAYVLEGIPGVNAGLARTLLAHFGSVRAVALAEVVELKAVPGIGPKRAIEIHKALSGET